LWRTSVEVDEIIKSIILYHIVKDCHESYDFRFYQFEMDNIFFKSANTFLSLHEYNKEKNSANYISLLINGKNEKIFCGEKNLNCL
jgi:hypothetical protein